MIEPILPPLEHKILRLVQDSMYCCKWVVCKMHDSIREDLKIVCRGNLRNLYPSLMIPYHKIHIPSHLLYAARKTEADMMTLKNETKSEFFRASSSKQQLLFPSVQVIKKLYLICRLSLQNSGLENQIRFLAKLLMVKAISLHLLHKQPLLD